MSWFKTKTPSVLEGGTCRDVPCAFKTGDIVTLKSGGPKMTVVGNLLEADGPEYDCMWFADVETKSDWFPEASLTLV